MAPREPDDLARLGSLLGETYGTLAGATDPSGQRSSSGLTAETPAFDTFSALLHPGVDEAATIRSARMVPVVWPDVVGAEVAANARPVQLRRKRLVVSVSSTVWAQTLQFMGPTIMAGINERLGAEVVGEIVFRHAGWEDPARGGSGAGPLTGRRREEGESLHGTPIAPVQGRSLGVSDVSATPAVVLSAEQEAALADVERLDLAPDLRDRIIRAMRAAFVRGEQDPVR